MLPLGTAIFTCGKIREKAQRRLAQDANPGDQMGRFGRRDKPPKEQDEEPIIPRLPAEPAEDDQYEDGDIATPKRDRSGPDDEPL